MDMDVRNIISTLEIPCAVCWGEENTENSIKNMEKLEEIAAGAQYLIFEKTKAYPHIENAVEFANEAHEFFK
jgi:pimeloyl-ACP methyl ester carboxylesterase